MNSLTKELKLRRKDLEKQSKSLPKSQCKEDEIWEAEINAKLDLIGELIGKKKLKGGKNKNGKSI